jgi:hypothetical protein
VQLKGKKEVIEMVMMDTEISIQDRKDLVGMTM